MKKWKMLILLSILIFGTLITLNSTKISKADVDPTLVQTSGGRTTGTQSDGIYQYLGIPYAQATQRFERARPSSWSGVYQANKYGKISIQSTLMGMTPSGDTSNQSNNAQNLNIWTPGVKDNKKRPIMVWIHGGGFSTGSANEGMYNGANLSKSGDAVVIGVNHRLNAYGYLDLAKYSSKYKDSANVGLWDLIDSLQWIKKNAAQFGGDPNNITLVGQSGGGAKILALMSSPNAKGLFNRAIVESGATDIMGVTFTNEEVSQDLTSRILQKLNISKNNIDKIQSVPNEELQAAADSARAETGEKYGIKEPLSDDYGVEWGPVVGTKFLPTNPVTKDGFSAAGKDIPLLIGSNINEWAGIGGTIRNNMTDEEKAAYKEAYPEFTDANAPYVDTFIRLPMLKIMNHKADQHGANVYSYLYTNGGANNQATHGAELPYVFDNEPGQMADIMSSSWINFARTGNPGTGTTAGWTPYTKENGTTMILSTNPRIVHHHDQKLMNLLEPDYQY